MKAVVLEDARKIVVREIPDAEMRETTDVLLRLTSTAICGTDLHLCTLCIHHVDIENTRNRKALRESRRA